MSLDGVYDCPRNRKAIFNRGMVPNINANPRGRKSTKRGCKPFFNEAILKERFNTIEPAFGWENKFRRLLLRFERLSQLHYAIKNPRSKLRGIGGRKEGDQKNAASCGEYVPKEIQIIGLFDDKPTPLLLASNHHGTRYKMALEGAMISHARRMKKCGLSAHNVKKSTRLSGNSVSSADRSWSLNRQNRKPATSSRCHALKSSGTMRFRRRAGIEIKAIATNATR